jgi:hypothetical protein
VLAAGEQLEDAPADRVAEYVERVHVGDFIRINLYKSILILRAHTKPKSATPLLDRGPG